MKPRLAILASGEGTTAEACIRAAATGHVNYDVVSVICSRKQAGIFGRIERLNQAYNLKIPCVLINQQTHPAAAGEVVQPGGQTIAEENALIEAIEQAQVDLVVLLGYMKRVGPTLVKRFGWRTDYTSPYQAMMLNTHPGLLPDTKGLFGLPAQQHIVDQQLSRAGQTVHVVAEDYDDGPVVAEHIVPIKPDEPAEKLFARVQAAEKQFLPSDLETFIKGRQAYLTGRL